MTTNLEHELKQFTGSERFFRNPLFLAFLYTEGVRFLAQRASAYWLIDFIFSMQLEPEIKTQPFQAWSIEVVEGESIWITVDDGNLYIEEYRLEFRDFPLKNCTLWFIEGTLLLPSEY